MLGERTDYTTCRHTIKCHQFDPAEVGAFFLVMWWWMIGGWSIDAVRTHNNKEQRTQAPRDQPTDVGPFLADFNPAVRLSSFVPIYPGGFVSSVTPLPTSSWLPESIGALLAEGTMLKYIVYTHTHWVRRYFWHQIMSDKMHVLTEEEGLIVTPVVVRPVPCVYFTQAGRGRCSLFIVRIL